MTKFAIAFFALIVSPCLFAAKRVHVEPVIDMHIHAYAADEVPGGTPICPGDQNHLALTIDPKDEFSLAAECKHPLLAARSDAELRDATIAELRKHGVRHAMTEGPIDRVADWRRVAQDLILPGVGFGKMQDESIDDLRRLYAAGQLQVLGEVYIQYRGHRADDARYEPYFALAEELDIPVGVHMGEGPPGAGRFPGYENYRVSMGSPLLLEEVLRKHPKLRVYVMHYGSPLVDEMIAMMFTYPNLYVDVSCNNWLSPRAQFLTALKRMIDAGMEKRIMFGTDQMYWPDAIGLAINAIDTAPFLNAAQKRDILYNNAARFLRFSKEQIDADLKTR